MVKRTPDKEKVDIRKVIMIGDSHQEKLNEIQEITEGSEGSIIRASINCYHKKIVDKE